MAYTIGDTIRLQAKFYNFSKALADPDTVTANVYSYIGQHLLETGAATKESIGVYYYDYVIPDVNGDIAYEFTGLLDGTPTVIRATFSKVWV